MELPATLKHAEAVLDNIQSWLDSRNPNKKERGEKTLWELMDRIFHEPQHLTVNAYHKLFRAVQAADPKNGLEHMDMAWTWVSALSASRVARHHETFLLQVLDHSPLDPAVRQAWDLWLGSGIERGHEVCMSLKRQWHLIDLIEEDPRQLARMLDTYPFEEREAFLSSQFEQQQLDRGAPPASACMGSRRL